MSLRSKTYKSVAVHHGWAGGLVLLCAWAWLAVGPARAEIIPLSDMLNGTTVTQAQCGAKPNTVWVHVKGEAFCIRYYISTAGGDGSQAAVYLSGDKFGPYNSRSREFRGNGTDVDTDVLSRYARTLSKRNRTTGIYLARVGLDGSSGFHGIRHSVRELHAMNAALDAIKRRHKLTGFHLVGQSAGATLAGGLMALRQDIGCAVLGSGMLSVLGRKRWSHHPAEDTVDVAKMIPDILRNRPQRIMVVTDPEDRKVAARHQFSFVDDLRRVGGHVESFLVQATDKDHHGVALFALAALSGCVRNESERDIAGRLKKMSSIDASGESRDSSGISDKPLNSSSASAPRSLEGARARPGPPTNL